MPAAPFSLNSFSLDGRVAAVTGAGRGIGQAIAAALARAGADVVLTARDPARLDTSEELVAKAGRRVWRQRLDVTDEASLAAAFDAIAAEAGGLDILVNNAGVEDVRPALDLDEALWDRILDTNLKGAFFASQAAARLMQARGGGAILNVCSLTSEAGVPTAVPYGASKTGLLGMTRALAAEWGPLGIRVNGIGPGYFRTALTEGFFADAAWTQAMLGKIPAGRFGQMEDLMGAAVFLCGPAASYITGQVLYVDGGTLAAL